MVSTIKFGNQPDTGAGPIYDLTSLYFRPMRNPSIVRRVEPEFRPILAGFAVLWQSENEVSTGL
jgi:hypothetical protein